MLLVCGIDRRPVLLHGGSTIVRKPTVYFAKIAGGRQFSPPPFQGFPRFHAHRFDCSVVLLFPEGASLGDQLQSIFNLVVIQLDGVQRALRENFRQTSACSIEWLPAEPLSLPSVA